MPMRKDKCLSCYIYLSKLEMEKFKFKLHKVGYYGDCR